MLIKDMGRAGVAILVLGAAACSDDVPEADIASANDDSEPHSTAADQTTPDEEVTSPTTTSGGGHLWARANLGFVSAYILYRTGEAAVVDTGVAGSEGPIEAALGEVGLGWGDVGHLILTHRHLDHQGSVGAVLAATEAPWYVGAGDLGAIDARNGAAVGDGDSVFGLDVIETPGHTAGHISILDPTAGILVAGDALNGANGGVIGANPDFTEDMTSANKSIAKLATFEYEVALFGHGDPVLSGASGLVADLAGNL